MNIRLFCSTIPTYITIYRDAISLNKNEDFVEQKNSFIDTLSIHFVTNLFFFLGGGGRKIKTSLVVFLKKHIHRRNKYMKIYGGKKVNFLFFLNMFISFHCIFIDWNSQSRFYSKKIKNKSFSYVKSWKNFSMIRNLTYIDIKGIHAEK